VGWSLRFRVWIAVGVAVERPVREPAHHLDLGEELLRPLEKVTDGKGIGHHLSLHVRLPRLFAPMIIGRFSRLRMRARDGAQKVRSSGVLE